MNCANHPEREKIAFCQNCGKPLCQECARIVGQAVFCEPCLEARLAGAPGNSPYTAPPGGTPYTAPPVTPGPEIPPPPANGEPNPGLAAFLGLIPGVGAMYNGQYAKGIVHLVVFAVLISLTDEHNIFGLFVTGWIFYQVFEAYQTARARRDGTPLPNPFGLNDIGERLGFGRSWTSSGNSSWASPPPASVPPAPEVPPAAAYPPPPANYPPPGATWGAPSDSYTGSPYNASYAGSYTPPPFDPGAIPPPRNRFPAGAIWLIGLGLLFWISNTGFLHGSSYIFPTMMIISGVWLLISMMTSSGSLADDGTPYYRVRLFNALRGSVWIILAGVMFLLSSLNILSWGKSWPLFIIVAGVMILAERAVYQSVPAPPAYPVPPTTPPPPAASTSFVPQQEDSNGQQEGR